MRPLLQCSLREWEKTRRDPGRRRLGVSARAAHHHSAHRDAVHVGGGDYVPSSAMSNQITTEAQGTQRASAAQFPVHDLPPCCEPTSRLVADGPQVIYDSRSRRRSSSRSASMISRRSTFGLRNDRFMLNGSVLSLK